MSRLKERNNDDR